MHARILFLGTAGDSIVAGTQARATGGIVIEYDEMKLILNPGPGTIARAAQNAVSMREIDAVIVTKNDLLSTGDLNACVDAMTNGGLDKRGVVVCSYEVLDGNQEYQPAMSPLHQKCLEKVIPLRLDDSVALNNIEIVPTHTNDTSDRTFGVRLSTPQFIVSYVGASVYDKDIVQEHKGCDILILNFPSVLSKENKTTSLEDIKKFITEIKPNLAIITGFGIKILQDDILTHVRNIQRDTGVQTTAAKDGLAINPLSFSALVRQQKLA
ncbi:MAG: hypothetical protein ACI8Y7_000627 [Candidatus Woesearchaeota archaeon]|jgi:hypothetical protein